MADEVANQRGRRNDGTKGLIEMALTFFGTARYDRDRMALEIDARVGDRPIMCFVSEKALRDHLGLKRKGDDARILRYLLHRNKVERRLLAKFKANAFEDDGAIVLRSQDF